MRKNVMRTCGKKRNYSRRLTIPRVLSVKPDGIVKEKIKFTVPIYALDSKEILPYNLMNTRAFLNVHHNLIV